MTVPVGPDADDADAPDGSAVPGGSAAPSRARLFVAVWLTGDVADAVDALPRPDEPGVRWVPRWSWHVTLRFLGTAPVDEARTVLADLEHPPVRAEVGPAVHRLGRSVVCLPVAGLDGLAAAVVARTAEVGQPPDPRPFAGHITLARLRRRAACGVAGHPFRAQLPVAEVALVRSTTGHEGPRYDTVERVPLVG